MILLSKEKVQSKEEEQRKKIAVMHLKLTLKQPNYSMETYSAALRNVLILVLPETLWGVSRVLCLDL